MRFSVEKDNFVFPHFKLFIVFICYMLIIITVFQTYTVLPYACADESEEEASSERGKTVNLLVLGTDLPLEGTKDAGRSDSINLFSVSLDSAVIRCITFERSIPVYVPEIYEKDMLTNVYHWAKN